MKVLSIEPQFEFQPIWNQGSMRNAVRAMTRRISRAIPSFDRNREKCLEAGADKLKG
jgi:hypothetical protein